MSGRGGRGVGARYEDLTYERVVKYNPEEKVDPLSDNIMDPKIFALYRRKRLLRIDRYLKERDASFDFMIIGKQPWELVDDDL